MSLVTPEENWRLALHAYTLGYAPVVLELDARWRWEMAELAEGPDLIGLGGDNEPVRPEEDSPFPVDLARYLREVEDASAALVDSLPRRTRGRLSKALADDSEAAWAAYEEAWLGPGHRAKLREKEAAGGGLDMLKVSPFVGPAWHRFRRAVKEFGDSLPEPLRSWVALGAHLAAAERIMPPTFGQDPLPEQVNTPPYPVAMAILRELKARDPDLDGLETLSADGWYERQEQSRRLHDQILSRLGTSVELAGGGHERWITASQALSMARGMGVTRSLSWLSKVSDCQPPPFKSRREGRRRRVIELVSFVGYLLDTFVLTSHEAADSGKGRPSVRPKSAIQSDVERQQEQEEKERARRDEVARAAREKTVKERGIR